MKQNKFSKKIVKEKISKKKSTRTLVKKPSCLFIRSRRNSQDLRNIMRPLYQIGTNVMCYPDPISRAWILDPLNTFTKQSNLDLNY